MSGAVHLSLISHTNVGKTTLARTLLRRDVGEVFDQTHVTDVAEEHVLIETAAGESLRLWDTPGFGDSFRLWRRLQRADTPIVGFVTSVWDRFQDRAFWCCQQAILNVRDRADVVLYLANAAEEPEELPYLKPELEILRWLGKPVVILLNQLGESRGGEADRADWRRWEEHFTDIGVACEVLPFDAFARCWVQEGQLWKIIGGRLDASRADVLAACAAAWLERDVKTFRESMTAVAGLLAGLVRDNEEYTVVSLTDRVLGKTSDKPAVSKEKAEERLAQRRGERVARTVTELVRLHGLTGEEAAEIGKRFKADFDADAPASEGKYGGLSGLISGVLVGLKADVVAGGLTLGGGMIVGGLAGFTGGVGLAKGINFFGDDDARVSWSADANRHALSFLLLEYLAVAQFGRGRGAWRGSQETGEDETAAAEHPKHWLGEVEGVLEGFEKRLEHEFKRVAAEQDESAGELPRILEEIGSAVLERLHGDAVPAELLAWKQGVVEVS